MASKMETLQRSLTGHELFRVEKAFGKPFEELAGTGMAYALKFVQLCRTDMTVAEAYAASLDCTLGELNDEYEEDDEGLGEGSPGEPASLPSSALPPEFSPPST